MINYTFKKTCLATVISMCLSFSTNAALAQATPSHVFQVTADIRAELAQMHKTNLSKPKDVTPNLTPRKPRHVLQKAREIYNDVQKLRESKGLTVNTLAPLPVQDVKPQDVKGLVDKALVELREARTAFGSALPSPATLPSGKNPTDVYGNLVKAKASIGGLGIPKTTPNNVYRVALSIIADLESVASAKGKVPDFSALSPSKKKKPKDVYAESYTLLEQLKQLTGKSGFSIPGGVVMPNKASGRITPATVIDIMNNILADIGAIKQVSGVTTPTAPVVKQKGKTPSHVYDAVMKAQAVVQSLMQ